MICYLDRTFCSSPDCTNDCGRKFTKEHEKGAALWAKQMGIESAPIAYSDFCSNIKAESNNETKE